LKANVYLKQGRLDKAQDWVVKRGLSAEDETSYLNEFEHLVLARVLIAEYRNQRSNDSVLQAIGLLERLLKAAEAQRRTGSVLETLVVQALAHQVQGNLPLALAALGRALALAQPEGYLRLFVDEGEPMRMLIFDFRLWIEKQSGDQDHALNGYIERLLAAFERPAAMPQTKINHPKSTLVEPGIRPAKDMLVESLSERELEVLRLVAQGLTNHEISQRLVLALSTVKGHNLRIFGKLQARNRSEAVARARELGLL
jgi:LuxR family maltose regulon positive regulatory protein